MPAQLIYRLSAEVWSLTNPGGNYTNNGYPTRIPSIKRPGDPSVALDTGLQAAGDGVLPIGHSGSEACPNIQIIPFGAGSATNTMGMKVLGWRATKLGLGTQLWVPVTLVTYAITLGTGTGIVNADLTTAALFATTITSTGGPTFITTGAAPIVEGWFQISPTGNPIGMIQQPTFGFRYLECIFTTGGSATSCNALWCRA